MIYSDQKINALLDAVETVLVEAKYQPASDASLIDRGLLAVLEDGLNEYLDSISRKGNEMTDVSDIGPPVQHYLGAVRACRHGPRGPFDLDVVVAFGKVRIGLAEFDRESALRLCRLLIVSINLLQDLETPQ